MRIMKKLSKTITFLFAITLLVGCKEETLEAKRAALAETRTQINAHLENIEDPELRREATELASRLVWLKETRIDQMEPPQSVVYDDDEPFLWMTDYPTSDEMVTNYAAGILAFTYVEYRLGTVNIQRPFDYPFDTRLVWKQIELADGTIVPVSGDFDITPPGVQVANFGTRLSVVPTAAGYTVDTPRPTRAIGTLKIIAPGQLTRLSLTRSDLGDAQRVGDYVVTLDEMKGHIVSIKVERQDGGVIKDAPIQVLIAAKDKTGRFLGDSGHSTGPSDESLEAYSEFLLELLAEVEKGEVEVGEVDAEATRRAESLEDEYGGEYFHKAFFRGEVDTVEVVFADSAEAQDIPLDLEILVDMRPDYDAPIEIEDISVQSIAYDHSLAYLTANDRVMELSAEDVANKVTIGAARIRGDDVYINFDYPKRTISSLFLIRRYDFRTGTVMFFDSDGQEILGDLPYKLTSGRLEYKPDGFPTRPARAVGSFDVNLMPTIPTQIHQVGALPDHIRVDGNKVIFETTENRIYAMDDNGRFLRRFHTQLFRSRIGPSTYVDYYYGNPSAVLILEPGETESVAYEFDIELD